MSISSLCQTPTPEFRALMASFSTAFQGFLSPSEDFWNVKLKDNLAAKNIFESHALFMT